MFGTDPLWRCQTSGNTDPDASRRDTITTPIKNQFFYNFTPDGVAARRRYPGDKGSYQPLRLGSRAESHLEAIGTIIGNSTIVAAMETLPGRLGDYVLSRRRGLGLTRDQVRAAGGPSDTRLASIEEGLGPAPTPSTLQKLDAALQWTPGSAAAIQRGGTPTELASGREPATLIGVSQVAVAADELADLISATDRLESEIRSQHRTSEVDGAVANLRRAVSALAGRWATDLLERNAGTAGVISPVIELAMGHLLDAPVDDTPEPERTERLYRRWLTKRDVSLREEQRAQFENRLARRRIS